MRKRLWALFLFLVYAGYKGIMMPWALMTLEINIMRCGILS